MSLAKLASMKKTTVDDAPEEGISSAGGEGPSTEAAFPSGSATVAAPLAAAATVPAMAARLPGGRPAGRPMGGVNVAAGWDAAGLDDIAGPDGETAPAAPASAAEPDDLEAALRSKMASRPVADLAAAASASSPAPSSEEAPSGNQGEAESLDAAVPDAEDPGAKPKAEDEFDSEEERLLELLRSSGMQPHGAAALMANYIANRKVCRQRMAQIDNSMRSAVAEIERAQASAPEGEGGKAYPSGFLGTLVSRMLGQPRHPNAKAMGELDGLKAERDVVVAAQRQAQLQVQDQIRAFKESEYRREMPLIEVRKDTFFRSIHDYNDAVLAAQGAAPVRDAVDAFAASQGIDRNAAIARIMQGQGPDGLADKMVAAAKAAAETDDAVKLARTEMLATQQSLEDGVKSAMQAANFLGTNLYEEYDLEKEQEELTNVLASIRQEMPDPIAEEAERQALRERMAEMFEKIKNAMDAVSAKLAGMFGAKPK